MSLNWEEVETGMNRAKLHNGWLVHVFEQQYDARTDRWDWVLRIGYFVPDANHEWTLDKQKKEQPK